MMLRKSSVTIITNTYKIWWNDGTYEFINGPDFISAFLSAGYEKLDYQALLCWEEL